jgi:hypothetical protein
MVENNYKIIVFDLDETLGYFQELSFFVDAIENIIGTKITKQGFYNLIDQYTEFLRPNILNILNLIKLKKQKDSKIKVMIYTNNQNPKKWVLDIKDYFNDKLNYNLFDKVIAAFKVNGEQIELSRTSHNKTYSDFIRCTKLPKNTNICFIDDQFHPGMINNNVYYIKVKPYTYTIEFKDMAERYYKNNSKDIKLEKKLFIDNIVIFMKMNDVPIHGKSEDELNIDIIVSKSIIQHLNTFLNQKINDRTVKVKIKYKKNKTLKTIK